MTVFVQFSVVLVFHLRCHFHWKGFYLCHFFLEIAFHLSVQGKWAPNRMIIWRAMAKQNSIEIESLHMNGRTKLVSTYWMRIPWDTTEENHKDCYKRHIVMEMSTNAARLWGGILWSYLWYVIAPSNQRKYRQCDRACPSCSNYSGCLFHCHMKAKIKIK